MFDHAAGAPGAIHLVLQGKGASANRSPPCTWLSTSSIAVHLRPSSIRIQ